MTVWGEGEPAVFVHGSFGWGEETWAKQRPLADSYRLLLVDRRGFGGSPPDGSVDFDRDADDVADVLGDGAHLVGHSYGGVVSLLAAARHPDAVRSLTVIEPPALGLVREDPFVETFITGVDEAMRCRRSERLSRPLPPELRVRRPAARARGRGPRSGTLVLGRTESCRSADPARERCAECARSSCEATGRNAVAGTGTWTDDLPCHLRRAGTKLDAESAIFPGAPTRSRSVRRSTSDCEPSGRRP